MSDEVRDSTESLLTMKEAADRLGISERTMRSVRASGALPVVRPSPGRIAVTPEDLRQYIEDRREVRGAFGRRRQS